MSSDDSSLALTRTRGMVLWTTVALALVGGFFLTSALITLDVTQGQQAPAAEIPLLHSDLQFWLGGFVLLLIGYHFQLVRGWLRKFAWLLWTVSVLATYAVRLTPLGVERYGSVRWLELGLFTFQPSELLKPAVVVLFILVAWKEEDYPWWLPPLLLFVSVVAVVIQPNLGGSGLILVLGSAALLLGGLDLKRIFAVWGLLAVLVGGIFLASPERMDYAEERLRAWHSRETVAQSSGYQVTKGLQAVAHGGWTGKGVLQSDLEFEEVPFVKNDFIFVAVADQTGLLGVFGVVGLFGFLLFAATKLALVYSREPTASIVAALAWFLVGQAALNMMTTLNLVPTTGVTLPFFSSGGSSLLVSFGTVALMLMLTMPEPEKSVSD